jgi:hypothetical protein
MDDAALSKDDATFRRQSVSRSSQKDYVFNCDGFGILAELRGTDMTERDAAKLLVQPHVESAITAIDWSILTTGEHNCRTRHGRLFDGVGIGRELDGQIGHVVQHFGNQPLDLLDIVIKHGQEGGLRVFGNIRLNHDLNKEHVLTLPGPTHDGCRKDFRNEAFQTYLLELFEDLLEKGVDGISLDFERKVRYFPDDATPEERIHAGTEFVQRARRLTSKPLIVRVAHEFDKGRPQGQDPLSWIGEGLVDAVVPATHNHEPDAFDWSFDDFVDAANQSQRKCAVWPQVWPTGESWDGGDAPWHSQDEILTRVREIEESGADGAYFFNFLGKDWTNPMGDHHPETEMFANLGR